MKRLRFDELILFSQKERSARRLSLHPTATVIKGDNDTGKSSLVKSLYWALGAKPPVIPPNWEQSGVVTSLRFRVSDVQYRVIRNGDRFSFFDGDDQLIESFVSITHGVSPFIAKLFDFRLQLPGKSARAETQATPAFLFLPFYIDQDSGWGNEWLRSFSRLQQFRFRREDVLRFHFGIRPSDYYLAKIRLAEIVSKANEVRREREILDGLLEDLHKELREVDFTVDIDFFKEEVTQLLERSNRLQQEEEQLRDRMAIAYGDLSAVRDQLRITKHALAELQADRKFASELEGDSVQCPTCHAEYANDFAERFSIAVDEDRCLGLLSELDQQKRKAEEAYQSAMQMTSSLRAESEEVEALLRSKKENLVLHDVIKSEGRREMLGLLRRQLSALHEQLGVLDSREAETRKKMKEYDDPKRKKEIVGYYNNQAARMLDKLDVKNVHASAYKSLGAPIKDSGSDVSRAVLAFVLASLRTIDKYSKCAMCPLVIDSPRQHDQDDHSFKLIREAIRDERPDQCQLILALTDDEGTDFGGEIVELDRKRKVLDTEEFAEVSEEIRPLIERSLMSNEDED